MALSDELERLAQLRDRGVLTDDEFARAKAELLSHQVYGGHGTGYAEPTVGRSFRRSRDDKWLGGICGGIARMTGIESWVWRLAFVALVVFAGVSLLLYLLLWIFIPLDDEATV